MRQELIRSGARTVDHLGTYLEELKASALAVAGEIAKAGKVAPSSRGYITPTEEDAIRSLQASYWQTRAALFELIDLFRREEGEPDEQYDEAFLVAFAGAILLVDAARFLREQFHRLKEVRHKLDEPAPEFGIPPRMYTQVQKSLTRSAHAWHLYQAVRYFDDHEARLRQLGARTDLAPVIRVIDRLIHRVRPSVLTYIMARLRVRARRAGQRVGRDVVGSAVYSIQQFVSSMMADVYVRPGHLPAIPQATRAELIRHLAPGDVLVVRKEYAMTNYFLPGYWPHAALYLGDARQLEELGIADHDAVRPRWSQITAPQNADPQAPVSAEPRRVLEAMKDGVRIRSLDSPFASDSVVVLRPKLAQDDIAHALARALAHEGKAYDFDFDFNRSDRLVCTEVIYRAYEGVGDVRFELARRAGRNTLAAGDLVRMAIARQHFEPVAVFAPRFSPDLLTGDVATRVLREAECDQDAEKVSD